ncbi:MAG: hypothetical protein H6603_11395 [Flavobacteriales bacterium]|nr:hypothetical protein [Flavobacteriales bacterium]
MSNLFFKPAALACLSLLVAFSSCCDLTFDKGSIPELYDAISRDKSSSYTDSAGNIMFLLFDFEDAELMEWEDHVGGCTTADGKFEYRVAGWKEYLGPGFKVYYGAYDRQTYTACPSPYISFGNSNSGSTAFLTCPELSGYVRGYADVTLQGASYFNCWVWTKSDSLGNELGKLIIDRQKGFLLFSLTDSFRWERIPD